MSEWVREEELSIEGTKSGAYCAGLGTDGNRIKYILSEISIFVRQQRNT